MALSFVRRVRQAFNPPERPAKATGKTVNFGSLGAAKITPFAIVTPALSHPEVIAYAVAARDKARAEAFAKQHGFQKSYGGPNAYQELLDDPQVDVVYNPLPNGLHFEWTMKALKAGKHVLLEKPATNTAAEAKQIFELASRKGLVVLEAFHNKFHPAVQRVKEIIESKELGEVKSISATLMVPAGTVDSANIRWDYVLGGGATMDPGCYTLGLLRYLAGSSPTSVLSATSKRHSQRPEHEKVEQEVQATLAFPNDIVGSLHAHLSQPWILGFIPRLPTIKASVECEGGSIEIYNYLWPHIYHYITVSPKGKQSRTEKAYSFKGKAKGEDWWPTYRYQLEAFLDKIQGRTPQTWIEPEDTIANMTWIEEIYAKTGFGSRPASTYVCTD